MRMTNTTVILLGIAAAAGVYLLWQKAQADATAVPAPGGGGFMPVNIAPVSSPISSAGIVAPGYLHPLTLTVNY